MNRQFHLFVAESDLYLFVNKAMNVIGEVISVTVARLSLQCGIVKIILIGLLDNKLSSFTHVLLTTVSELVIRIILKCFLLIVLYGIISRSLNPSQATIEWFSGLLLNWKRRC